MKKTMLFIGMLLGIAPAAQSQCTTAPASSYSFTYNGARYEVIKEGKSWVNAAACAVSKGGKLAEINSLAEQNAVFAGINNAGINAANTVAPDGGNASYLWIGGNDITTEGRWVWDGNNDGNATQFWQGTSTGNAVGGRYSNWGNEPDNFTSQNGLGLAFTNWPLGQAGQWNDVKENNLLYYVIEYPQTTAIPSIKKEQVSVYPNPVRQSVNIHFADVVTNQNYTLAIKNLLGQVVLQQHLDQQQTLVDLSGLYQPGVYFLEVTGADGLMYQQKIVKQ